MIPALDTVQGSRGLAACITSHSSPVTFVLGQVFHPFSWSCSWLNIDMGYNLQEPDLPPSTPPPFMEGLSYTEDQNSNLFYDSIQKMYLGECPNLLILEIYRHLFLSQGNILQILSDAVGVLQLLRCNIMNKPNYMRR